MIKFLKWCKSTFFPPRCALCDEVIAKDHMPICKECFNGDLPILSDELCNSCGREKKYCVCKQDHFISDGIAAPFYYQDSVKTALSIFKKTQDQDRTNYLVEKMSDAVYINFGDKEIDYVTCVPLHPKQFSKRGFNQAEILAKKLAEIIYTPYLPTLQKIFATRSQKGLSALERKANLLGAFDVITDVSFKNKNILLVDDIVTTGSTTNECAKMLKIYGAKKVYVAAVALTRANYKDDPIAEIRRRLKLERL